MNGSRNMTLLLIVVAVVLVAAFAIGWHYIFGRENPPLPAAQVSVAPSSTASSSSSASAPADSTDTDIANPTLPEEQLSIEKGTWTVELATSMVEQARGLSYRQSLGANSGMLFIFPSPGIQNFWMKDMHFALDMIWISDGTVAGFTENIPAPTPGTPLWSLPTYSSPSGVNEVLEVNAGTVAQYGIKVGDAVTVKPL